MATDKMSRARAALVMMNPFFGVLALRMRMEQKEDIRTAQTDGIRIQYNPEWIEKMPLSQVQGLLAHELLHCALLHPLRHGSREITNWNKACDYAINPILVDAKFHLPDGGLIDPSYKGMTAEHIYTLLPPATEEEKQNHDPGNCGAVVSSDKNDPNSVPDSQQEQDWKQAVAQAMYIAKQQGMVPAGLETLVEELLAPVIPWRDTLRRFMSEQTRDDYSWLRPNRRHIANDIYLPSALSEKMGEIVVVVDTSGSIGETELQEFGGEIDSIVQDVRPSKTRVIYCDAQINSEDSFTPGDQIVLRVVGGGGTDFRPPFELLDSDGAIPKCLIYLTDGYGTFPETEPIFPVLWAMTSDIEAPFGETIRMK